MEISCSGFLRKHLWSSYHWSFIFDIYHFDEIRDWNDLHIIFNAMMNFPEKHFFFLEDFRLDPQPACALWYPLPHIQCPGIPVLSYIIEEDTIMLIHFCFLKWMMFRNLDLVLLVGNSLIWQQISPLMIIKLICLPMSSSSCSPRSKIIACSLFYRTILWNNYQAVNHGIDNIVRIFFGWDYFVIWFFADPAPFHWIHLKVHQFHLLK